MSRLAPSVLVLAGILLGACAVDDGGADDDDGADGGAEDENFTCSATLAPAIFDYVVSGDLLELSGGGTTETWERVDMGDPGRLVHGTWHVGEQIVPGVGVVSLDFLVEPDQVSALAACDFGLVSGSARAVSAAEISDTSIEILESDEDIQVIPR